MRRNVGRIACLLTLAFIVLIQPWTAEASTTRWIRQYSGFFAGLKGYEICTPTAMVATDDGGFVVAGNLYKSPAALEHLQDAFIIKLSPAGKVLWSIIFNTDPSESPKTEIRGLAKAGDGGYLAAGLANSRAMVMKVTSLGQVQWLKTSSIYGEARGLIRTGDGNFVVMGTTGSLNWVFKIDAQGAIVWQNAFTPGSAFYANAIAEMSDGGFVAVGGSRDGAGSPDQAFVARLDAQGQVLWARQKSTDSGYPNSLAETVLCEPDGSFLVGGALVIPGSHGSHQNWLYKMDASGQILWQRILTDLSPQKVLKASDGGYLVFGGGVGKLTASGQPKWRTWFPAGRAALQMGSGDLVAADGPNPAPDVAGFTVARLSKEGSLGSYCEHVAGGKLTLLAPKTTEVFETMIVTQVPVSGALSDTTVYIIPRPVRTTVLCPH